MAKKYLLYIHSEEFEEEEKKSDLVNELLQRHYKVKPEIPVLPGQLELGTEAPVPTDLEVIEKIMGPVKEVISGHRPVKTLGVSPSEALGDESKKNLLCKHGSYPRWCKHAEVQKNGVKECKE